MAAGDVAGLMRDHADDLVGRLGLQQRARVDEHAAAGDEGVEARIVDENDVDARLRQSCGLEDRPGVVAHQRLDLGVAHDRHILRIGGDGAGRRHEHREQQRDRGAGEDQSSSEAIQA